MNLFFWILAQLYGDVGRGGCFVYNENYSTVTKHLSGISMILTKSIREHWWERGGGLANGSEYSEKGVILH